MCFSNAIVDAGVSKECIICCRDDVNATRYCVYCVSLVMCSECRRKLPRQHECPQCRRHLSDAPPDILITHSRPCPHSGPSVQTFNFRIVYFRETGCFYLGVGTVEPAHDIYARLYSRKPATVSLVLFTKGSHGCKPRVVKHKSVRSKEDLVKVVDLLPGVRHLSWSEMVAFLKYASQTGLRRTFEGVDEGTVVLPLWRRQRHR